MATYKVIQDIESEDKLLGPFTLRQFVYAAIVVVLGFICFKLLAVSPLLTLPFLPPMAFFGLLAAPFGHDQSSEVWLLAKIRFMLKPRRRIWNQSGIQQLVTVTAPKVVEKHLTDGLTQTEVKSRLQALANTIDSRGWAVKNVNVNLFNQPAMATADVSDRLVEASSLPQDTSAYEVFAADDIMDETNNPTAQHLQAMISQSDQTHRQTAVAAAQGQTPTQPPADYWFMNQPDPAAIPAGQSAFGASPVVTPGSQQLNDSDALDLADQQLLEKIHRDQEAHEASASTGNMRVIDPSGDIQAEKAHQKPIPQPPQPAPQDPPQPNPASANPAILRLATNDDLNIATIARQAQKENAKPLDDEEVVISLR